MEEIITKRIYRITAPNLGKFYYGSTSKPLNYRLNEHKSSADRYNNGNVNKVCSSIALIYDKDVKIEEVEVVSGTIVQIRERERHWIDNNPCVNKNKPGRDSLNHMRDKRKQAGKVHCGCGGRHYNTIGEFNGHIESRRHNDWVHARQVEYFKNKAAS